MIYSIDSTAHIRFARPDEAGTILRFIKELAEYEKMSEHVSATEEIIEKTLFQDKRAEVLFCEKDGTTVGFVLFFHNYSTFLGRPGIYLEDLYIKPEFRGHGYGKAFMKVLARIAVERKCGRIEWWCLDWNTKSIEFYKSLGAEPMSDWTVYRISGHQLKIMSES